MPLALLEYRKGNYAKSRDLSRLYLNPTNRPPNLNLPMEAIAHVVQAMSLWQMSQKGAALSEWSHGRSLINSRFKRSLVEGKGDVGFWFDWIIAKVLLHECEQPIIEYDRSHGAVVESQPNPEIYAQYHALGEWHAVRQEWRAAADDFEVVLKVNKSFGWRDTTGDQLAYGVLLAELGDTNTYDRFREEAISRFKGTQNKVIAEMTIRAIMLEPANEKIMADLAPLIEVAASPSTATNGNSRVTAFREAWRCASMGLLEYRRGNYAEAANWCRRSLDASRDIPPRSAAASIILAMSLQHIGQNDPAKSELQQVRDMLAQTRSLIENKFNAGLEEGFGDQGVWFDWVMARILLREATGQLSAPPAQAEPKAQ